MLKLKEKAAWSSYFRLLRYCAPYKGRLITALISMLAASVFNIIPPWLLKNVIDEVLIKKQVHTLNLLALGVVAIYIFKVIFSYENM